MKKEMAVCPDDGFPLVGTFMVMGAEYYCLKCRGAYGMLYEDHAKETPARLKKKEEAEKVVRFLSGSINTGGGKLQNCKKCFPDKGEGERYHVSHLTDEEKTAEEAAELILKMLATA